VLLQEDASESPKPNFDSSELSRLNGELKEQKIKTAKVEQELFSLKNEIKKLQAKAQAGGSTTKNGKHAFGSTRGEEKHGKDGKCPKDHISKN